MAITRTRTCDWCGESITDTGYTTLELAWDTAPEWLATSRRGVESYVYHESCIGHALGLLDCWRPRRASACPMTSRVDVLRRLARGRVYKQIATDLGMSTSTVRTHLHNVYRKLDVLDRAQAVLVATERGWLEHGDIFEAAA